MQCFHRVLQLAFQDRIRGDSGRGACLAACRRLEAIHQSWGRNFSSSSRSGSPGDCNTSDDRAPFSSNESLKPQNELGYPNNSGLQQANFRQKHASQLGHICRSYKSAVQRGDLSRTLQLLDSYHAAGGAPQLWMFDMLINLHARRRDMPAALAVQDLMHGKGLAPSQYVYNSLAVACSRARPTGYNLPKAAVHAAEVVLRDMAARGVPRDFTSYSIMMDVYAKAGMLPEAEAQMALLRAAGGTPGAREFAALLEACKRCNRPARAARILHTEMAAAGVAPDARAWNALLGAYGRNGDIDGAYATWQEMMRRRIVPSDITERELAEAFSSSPAFAADVVQQCKSFRALLAADGPAPEHGSQVPPASGSLLVAAFHVQGWLNWILHGMHYPAAIPGAPHAMPTTDEAPRSGADVPAAAAPARGAAAATAHSTAQSTATRTDVADGRSGQVRRSERSDAAAAEALQQAAPAAKLDVHRMNQAQARAALLQQLHVLSTALPQAEVDAEHMRVVAGAVRYPLGASADAPATVPLFPGSDVEPERKVVSHEPLTSAEAADSAEASPAPCQPAGAHTGQHLLQGRHASNHRGTYGEAPQGCPPALPGSGGADTRVSASADAGGAATSDAVVAAALGAGSPAQDACGGAPAQKAQAATHTTDCAMGSAGDCAAVVSTADRAASGSGAMPGGGRADGPAGGLVIIMGRGRTGASVARDTSEATLLDQNPLQLAVRDLLNSLQVGYHEVEDNPGRLHVPRAELLRFAARSQHRGEAHAMMRRMLFRVLALSVAASGLVQLMSDTTWPRLFIFVEDHF